MVAPSATRLMLTSAVVSLILIALTGFVTNGLVNQMRLRLNLGPAESFEVFSWLRFGILFGLTTVLAGYCLWARKWRTSIFLLALPVVILSLRWYMPPLGSSLLLWLALTIALYQTRVLRIRRSSSPP